MKKIDGLKPEYFITYNRPTELKREKEIMMELT